MRKGFVPILILSLVAAIFVLAGTLYFEQKSTIFQKQVPAVLPSVTANWQKYNATSCPVVISYPQSWHITDLKLAKGVDYTGNSLGCFKITSPEYITTSGEETGGRINISRMAIGNVFSNSKINNSDDYIAFLRDQTPVTNVQDKQYGTNTGKQYLTSGFFSETNFVFVEDSNLYIISWNEDSFSNSEKKLITQILSTFKFTDETANWKILTQLKMNFSIKYPSDIVVTQNSYVLEFALEKERQKDYRSRYVLFKIYNQQTGDLRDYVKSEYGQCTDCTISDIKVNNATGVKVVRPAKNGDILRYLLNNNGSILDVRLDDNRESRGGSTISDQEVNEFVKMMGTIMLLN